MIEQRVAAVAKLLGVVLSEEGHVGGIDHRGGGPGGRGGRTRLRVAHAAEPSSRGEPWAPPPNFLVSLAGGPTGASFPPEPRRPPLRGPWSRGISHDFTLSVGFQS